MSSEVVITGVGVVSPVGVGREAFWDSLLGGRSGLRRIASFDPSSLPVPVAGEVVDFDAGRYVKSRKFLKLMCRDATLGVAAAALACKDAGTASGAIDPDRFGVVLGADRICPTLVDSTPSYLPAVADGRFHYSRWVLEGMSQTFPLNFLKVLPNMIGSHVSITRDARGPNNTIHHGEVSSLLAVIEAAGVIRRGAADVMLAGGAASEMNEYDCMSRCRTRGLSLHRDDPAATVRPFDAERDGQAWGEGAAALVLESRRHAESRGAVILCEIAGWASTCETVGNGGLIEGVAVRRALGQALERSGVAAGEVGHVNAHGLGTPRDDRIEAQAIRDVLGDAPVMALKGYFGNLGAAGGAVELAASVLAIRHARVPPTLNYKRPDPDCPVRVVRDHPLDVGQPSAVSLNFTWAGQAAAVVLRAAG
jgi:3-oxoacyl-[acyl-carrier-protein] synthase II